MNVLSRRGQNALIVETVGRRSGKRRHVPVAYLEEHGELIVVVEHGLRAHWVQNALAYEGQLRIFLRGRWHHARLRLGGRKFSHAAS